GLCAEVAAARRWGASTPAGWQRRAQRRADAAPRAAAWGDATTTERVDVAARPRWRGAAPPPRHGRSGAHLRYLPHGERFFHHAPRRDHRPGAAHRTLGALAARPRAHPGPA